MNEDFSFMNEKIKDKPFHKKKWVQAAAATVALAVVFGAVAGSVFVAVSSKLKDKHQLEQIEIPKDHPTDVENSENAGEALEVTRVPEQEEETELTVEEWKSLYEKLLQTVREAEKSLVTVTAVQSDVDWFDEAYETSGQASGIIVGDNGVELLILTKYDAMKGCDALRVSFVDRTVISAALKKYDASTGFAVISVNLSDIPAKTSEQFTTAALGKSIHMDEGEPVLIAGRADGSENSVNAGMITSVHKSQNVVDGEYTVLVTDKVENPGSDGVILNLQGQIVGILTSKQLLPNAQNTLIGYGISDIKGLIEHLSNNQDVTYLGIKGASVPAEAKTEGMPSGVYVTEVVLDSPAMLGGMQAGDVLQKINGQKVENMSDVSRLLQKMSNKQKVILDGRRLTKDGYKQIQYEITLGLLE